jgi:hypothetical protein
MIRLETQQDCRLEIKIALYLQGYSQIRQNFVIAPAVEPHDLAYKARKIQA